MSEPLALNILRAVKHSGSLPIDYLEFRFGIDRIQAEEVVRSLESQGIVRLSANDVVFVSPSGQSVPPAEPSGTETAQ